MAWRELVGTHRARGERCVFKHGGEIDCLRMEHEISPHSQTSWIGLRTFGVCYYFIGVVVRDEAGWWFDSVDVLTIGCALFAGVIWCWSNHDQIVSRKKLEPSDMHFQELESIELTYFNQHSTLTQSDRLKQKCPCSWPFLSYIRSHILSASGCSCSNSNRISFSAAHLLFSHRRPSTLLRMTFAGYQISRFYRR